MEESVRFKPTAGGSFNPLSMYPIGSIYRSVKSTDPSELFGGTWQMLKDVFLMAAGDKYAAGSTGGEAQHKLTVDEMPNHVHPYAADWTGGGGSSNTNGEPWALVMTTSGDGVGEWAFGSDTKDRFGYIGGSQPHNNLPPYLAVYTWVRVA